MRPHRQRSHFAMPDRKRCVLSNERGVVFSIVLSVILALVIEFAALAQFASSAMMQVRAQENYTKSFYAAEATINKSLASIHWNIENNGAAAFTSFTPSFGGGSNITGTMSITTGATSTGVLGSGDYKGLTATTQNATITASATSTAPGASPVTINISQGVQVQAIPAFQFGIFYQNDLEIGPGVNMTFTGPVHTNSNLYVTADNGVSVTFNSAITAAKDILHSLKEGGSEAGVQGDVFIKDTSGVNQNMKNADATWMDSNYTSWNLGSQSRWGGNVKSSAQGVDPLSLPLQTGTQPHDIIERRAVTDSAELKSQKFDYKAHIRIIDGAVQTQAGASLELRYCKPAAGANTVYNGASCPAGSVLNNPISSGTFYDGREQKMVVTTNLDLAKLQASPNFTSIASAATGGVILYHSDHTYDSSTTTEAALRVINGSTLPNNGITVSTENPLFVKGDYNTVSKKPAGLVSDAVDVLSNAWLDSNDASSSSSLASRVASNTTVNAAIISGNTESTPGHYNGGIENIMRLLENWSGKTYTYSGSIVILYDSEKGNKQWGNSNVYSPPARNWSYDAALTNAVVPGFPSVYNVYRLNYEQT